VFFINIPVGIVTFYGIWKYLRPTPAVRRMKIDLFGFTALSLAVGALQMLLDRGQQNDWFSSTETWAELIVLVVAATYFVAHTMLTPAEKSFFDYRLLKNTNYATGTLFIFVVGLVMYASRALIPTMLESLLGYPVATTGLITSPSGIGTMLAMLVAGRLIGKVSIRLMLTIGFVVLAISLWEMSRYSLDIGVSEIIWPGVWQGIGLGLVFVPLSTSSFATLDAHMRSQGTAIFSLVRNIGSSIGISLVQFLLVRNTVIAHASLVERVTYANPAWSDPAVASAYNLHSPAGAAALDSVITQQATMIAYIDDFWLMCILSVVVLPLVLLLKPPPRYTTLSDAPAVIE
jgi:DHA2 family multidrug resistance protein